MALQKTLLKKRLKYWHPLPPKTSYCDKTIGSRELIFGTIPIKKCMNALEFFSAKSETVEWGNDLKLVRLAWNDSYLSVPTLAITSASSRCTHRLTIKLAAHFPYLTMIKHGLT